MFQAICCLIFQKYKFGYCFENTYQSVWEIDCKYNYNSSFSPYTFPKPHIISTILSLQQFSSFIFLYPLTLARPYNFWLTECDRSCIQHSRPELELKPHTVIHASVLSPRPLRLSGKGSQIGPQDEDMHETEPVV